MLVFSIVGLPEMAAKESKDRGRGALLTACFEFPRRRLNIDLAPADLPKEGGASTLPSPWGCAHADFVLLFTRFETREYPGNLRFSGRRKCWWS